MNISYAITIMISDATYANTEKSASTVRQLQKYFDKLRLDRSLDIECQDHVFNTILKHTNSLTKN